MQIDTVYNLIFRNLILISLTDYHVTGSRIKCAERCSMTSDCYSFFYDIGEGRCYLVDGYVTEGGSGTSVRENVVYYSKPKTPSPCRTDIGFQEETTLNLCYKVKLYEMDVAAAQRMCKSAGGDLATAKTPQIETFYFILLNPYGKDMFFGATDDGSPGFWRWVDDTPWPDFTQTASGKHCLKYSQTGNFAPEQCTNRVLPFVCEIVMPTRIPLYG